MKMAKTDLLALVNACRSCSHRMHGTRVLSTCPRPVSKKRNMKQRCGSLWTLRRRSNRAMIRSRCRWFIGSAERPNCVLLGSRYSARSWTYWYQLGGSHRHGHARCAPRLTPMPYQRRIRSVGGHSCAETSCVRSSPCPIQVLPKAFEDTVSGRRFRLQQAGNPVPKGGDRRAGASLKMIQTI